MLLQIQVPVNEKKKFSSKKKKFVGQQRWDMQIAHEIQTNHK